MYPLFPPQEIYSRVLKLQKLLDEKGIDAAVFTYRAYCLYFSGSSQLMTMVIPRSHEPRLFVKRAVERAREESPWEAVEVDNSYPIFSFLRNFKKIGLPFDRITADQLLLYRERFPGDVVDISREVKSIKAVKSEFEISCIRRAGEIAEKVFLEACNYLKEGMTEIEVGGIFDMLGKRFGSESFLRTGDLNYEAYCWHVVSGSNAHYRSYIETVVGGRGLSPSFPCGAGRKVIKRDEPFMVDFGASYMGYLVDHARMYVIGGPPKGFLESYSKILKLQEKVERFCKPGVVCEDAFLYSMEVSRELGIEDIYLGGREAKVNFLAHGIGLEISDLPIIGKGQRYTLKEGMTFAMEPKLIDAFGPCGVEDVYVVKNKGVERLTRTPNGVFVL